VLPFAVRHRYFHRVDCKLLSQGRDERGALKALVDDVDNVPPVAPKHASVVVELKAGDPVCNGVDDP